MSADMGLPKFLHDISQTFTATANTRIMFIVGDGRCNKDLVRPLALQLAESNIMAIYIILDKKEEKGSVLNIRSTDWITDNQGKRKLQIKQYMDEGFTFFQGPSELVLMRTGAEALLKSLGKTGFDSKDKPLY